MWITRRGGLVGLGGAALAAIGGHGRAHGQAVAVLRRVRVSDEISLATWEWKGRSKQPLILVHGFTSSTRQNWEESGVIGALASAGLWIIGVDARGHGASNKPHDPARYGWRRIAQDVVEVADAYSLQAYDYAGYSMGGALAPIVATSDPRVKRLGVCGCIGQFYLNFRTDPVWSLFPAALRADDPSTIVAPAARAFRGVVEARAADRLALAACLERGQDDWDFAQKQLPAITQEMLLLGGTADPYMARPERVLSLVKSARLETVAGDHPGTPATPEFGQKLAAFFAG
jgi:pimeloyl-ACP methyl ester carboxylesterase